MNCCQRIYNINLKTKTIRILNMTPSIFGAKRRKERDMQWHYPSSAQKGQKSKVYNLHSYTWKGDDDHIRILFKTNKVNILIFRCIAVM